MRILVDLELSYKNFIFILKIDHKHNQRAIIRPYYYLLR